MDVIKGTFKSFLGFVLIGAGGGVIVGTLESLTAMFSRAFGIAGVLPNNEAIIALALVNYGDTAVWILFFGMAANIIFARLTPLKYVFLSTHLAFYMACLIGIVMAGANVSTIPAIIAGAVILGFAMVTLPALAQPFMRKISKNDDIALGHFGTLGHVCSGYLGKLLRGRKTVSTEDIPIPKSLGFLQDNTVSVGITMCVLFLIMTVAAGRGYVEMYLSGGTHFIVFAVMQAIIFTAGIFIVFQGVQMMIAEILPAFRGISEKLIPGARPAFDCPIVFPYAPNAVLIGFISSFAAGTIGMFILAVVGNVVIIPGVAAHFFAGAAAAVFGNSTGGIRGAVAGSFINGLLMAFTPLLLLPFLGDLAYAGTIFSDVDFIFIGSGLGWVLRLIFPFQP